MPLLTFCASAMAYEKDKIVTYHTYLYANVYIFRNVVLHSFKEISVGKE